MIFVLALLPLLGSLTQVHGKEWPEARTVDFQLSNPDRLEYTFEPVKAYDHVAYPKDSPSYPWRPEEEPLELDKPDDETDNPPPNMIARLWIFGDNLGPGPVSVVPGMDIFWTRDRNNKDIVRKKCRLYFDSDPETDVVWNIAESKATAKDDHTMDQKVREVTHFDCVEDPESGESTEAPPSDPPTPPPQ